MPDTVVHITGARPNFPKAAPVLSALESLGVDQLLVHTGQHYDSNMSDVFFADLGIRPPDVNLGIGSGSHAAQTAAVMVGLEEVLLERRPTLVTVYGDINSTVAAALVASKLGTPVAHVEAGLRSFDRSMPEEINRIVTDQLSDLLFVTSPEAIAHLAREGAEANSIHFVGNPMIDTLLGNRDRFEADQLREQLGLPAEYAVATLHRPANVDAAETARQMSRTLSEMSELIPTVLPLHPRGRKQLEDAGLRDGQRLHVIEPLGYIDFLGLVSGAAAVVTDSGGIQEETTVLGVPCLTLRPNTERPITITHGTNELVTRERLADRLAKRLAAGRPTVWDIPPLWDGHAGERIARLIADYLKRS